MKKLVLLVFVFSICIFAKAQKLNDMVELNKFSEKNASVQKPVKGEKRVVFIGNSITEGWADKRSEFFESNNFIGRGIGGQTSPQILLRFRQDVINLQPKVVVINIGTNDIAGNTGDYNPQFTMDNIRSMTDLALANGITPVLASVLPVTEYWWNKSIKDIPQKVDALNEQIKAYAKSKKLLYIDYNTSMRDKKGGLIKKYGDDGVHPTQEGYKLMEKIVTKELKKVL